VYFSAYYVESEQIPAACGLGVLVDTDCSIKAAGGFIVQLMPGAPEGLIEKLEDNIFFMDQLTTILDEDGVEEIIAQVLKGLEPRVLEESEAEYRCYCSRERVAEALRSVGQAALEEIAQQTEPTEVGCQFCDKVYVFTQDDIKELI